MSKGAMYTKLVLLVLAVTAAAMLLGIEPWGPN
jgi:hypothetical protein